MPPFPGETAEQLAAQHRNGAPRLTPLPPADRPIIARALAKDPGKRFASCRDLIAALRGPAHAATCGNRPTRICRVPRLKGTPTRQWPVASQSRPKSESRCPGQITMGLSGEPDARRRSTRSRSPCRSSICRRSRSPGRIDFGRRFGWGSAARPRQSSGISASDSTRGSADLSGLPALQMLLVDTDRETIARATQGDEAHAFQDCETLLTPLRKSQEYRERSEEYLRWLSRRWLYNIPFSGRTEGFRPLGRLAFVDHVGEIARRLRDALKSITAPESLASDVEGDGHGVPRS